MKGVARRLLRAFRCGEEATSAIEFALTLPISLLLYFGTYEISESVSAYRKVSLTTRTVVDLTTQYTAMAQSDISNVLGASTQVMAPFNTSNIAIVLTEYLITAPGFGQVQWSQAQNASPLQAGAIVAVPSGVATTGSYIVSSSVSYSFRPAVGYLLTGSFTMSDTLFMVPRQSNSITLSGS